MTGKLDIQEENEFEACNDCGHIREIHIPCDCPCHKDTTSMEEKCKNCEHGCAMAGSDIAGYKCQCLCHKNVKSVEARGTSWRQVEVMTQEATPSLPEWSEDWKAEFREYFDKTLKPKKATMANLDRELCIDFISKVKAQAEKRTLERAIGPMEGLLNKYVGLVESGDAGYWNCEKEKEVINARQFLSQSKDNLNKLLTNHE